MEKYSAEWVQEELKGKKWMPLRRCSMCNQAIGYIQEEGLLSFASSCGCTRGYTPAEPRSWDSIVSTLAMQSSDEIRDKIMETLKGEREPA